MDISSWGVNHAAFDDLWSVGGVEWSGRGKARERLASGGEAHIVRFSQLGKSPHSLGASMSNVVEADAGH